MTSSTEKPDFELAKWRITKREVLRVVLRSYRGRRLIDIRRWYYDADMQLRPGKGISLPPEAIGRLRRALRKVSKHIGDDDA
jgi:hypothetical protein